ncbi:MAG TPA: hypothetical protein DCQ31_03530, partial [Bacteroidales bacterium]|nr:hypothetical protein [Bacteroidales bacterium]
KEKTSKKLNQYFEKENWKGAKKLLVSELNTAPNDHFLLTQLGEVYYEMRQYPKALEYTQKAVEILATCPLALNNYAVVLYMHEKYAEAIEIWLKLLNTTLSEIAYGTCNEGMRFAKSLQNDIRFRLADAYLALGNKKIALEYYQSHYKNRKRGLFSNFSKKESETEIRNLNISTSQHDPKL